MTDYTSSTGYYMVDPDGSYTLYEVAEGREEEANAAVTVTFDDGGEKRGELPLLGLFAKTFLTLLAAFCFIGLFPDYSEIALGGASAFVVLGIAGALRSNGARLIGGTRVTGLLWALLIFLAMGGVYYWLNYFWADCLLTTC